MKDIKLYNLIFPFWLLIISPPLIIVAVVGNFIIDSLVVLITMKVIGVKDVKKNYKKTILNVWGLGFFSDIIGVIWLMIFAFGIGMINNEVVYSITSAISYNPFANIGAFILVTIGIAIAGYCIYRFNLKSLQKTDLTLAQQKRVALSLAIITAPYFFYLPIELFM